MVTKENKKWTNDEIITLIDAYKEESCLYAVNSLNYHNKHLRSEALKRVGDAMRAFKSHVFDKDCASKFHTLRSQYNIENSKVKLSKKSGTGTDISLVFSIMNISCFWILFSHQEKVETP